MNSDKVKAANVKKNKEQEKIGFAQCILLRNKNNFMITAVDLLKKKEKKVMFNRTCGSLEGIQGSKKYTTVALGFLGRASFLEFAKRGFTQIFVNLIVTSKIDKFVKSYVDGFFSHGRRYSKMFIKLEIVYNHNGVKSRKLRRV